MAGGETSDLPKDCSEGSAEHISGFAVGEINRFARAEAEPEGMKAQMLNYGFYQSLWD